MMGRRKNAVQQDLWVPAHKLAEPAGHPFYQQVNRLLASAGFDAFVQRLCAPYYTLDNGRPGVPPEVYFRMLMLGYFEGIDSERGIAWRCGDSLALRSFLGYGLERATPDHSSLSRIRGRIPVEVHQEVFAWVLARLAERGLVDGKTVAVDATTLEANAAMRSIVRRDSGQRYDEFLTGLAVASGIETPSRQDLARLDRKRKKTTPNKDWTNPNDPDAKIAKMKDGRTHLAHKAEHAVDLASGAVLAVTLQGADTGDTTSLDATLVEAVENLDEVKATGMASREDEDGENTPGAGGATESENACDESSPDGCLDNEQPCTTSVNARGIEEVVADKGYHSNDTCLGLRQAGMRSYIAEPERGRRKWKGKPDQQEAVYANRRRIKGQRGKALMRKRGELVERSFAHCYETGGMRRTHLRGHPNILKRLLVHVAAFNLSLILRRLLSAGTPRSLQGGLGRLAAAFCAPFGRLYRLLAETRPPKNDPAAVLTPSWYFRSTPQVA